MRYVVYPSDDGRFFIFDTKFDKVIVFCGNQLLANKVARILNEDISTDITKTH